MKNGPTVYVLDDDQAIREGIKDLVETLDMPAQTFSNAEEFLDLCKSEVVHGCLVLDIRMPGIGGMELQNKLIEENIHLPVVIITGHGDVPMAVKAIKNGAVDFIEKPFREQVLLDSIKKALEKTEKIAEEQKQRKAYQEKLKTLTERESEVINHLISGKSDKEIAHDLFVSQRAVAFHRSHILEKMGAKSTVELTRSLTKLNLI